MIIPTTGTTTSDAALIKPPSPNDTNWIDEPRPTRAIPAALNTVMPLAMLATEPSFALMIAVRPPLMAVAAPANACSEGASASPMASAVPSTADNKIRNAPPRPASISFAALAAVPSALRNSSAKPRTPPAADDSTLALVMPSRPNACAIFAVRSATGMFAVT